MSDYRYGYDDVEFFTPAEKRAMDEARKRDLVMTACDACGRDVPADELYRVKNTSAGEGHFCSACCGGDDEWDEGNASPEEGR